MPDERNARIPAGSLSCQIGLAVGALLTGGVGAAFRRASPDANDYGATVVVAPELGRFH